MGIDGYRFVTLYETYISSGIILPNEQQYHRRKIRELLEIEKAKTSKRKKVLNRLHSLSS